MSREALYKILILGDSTVGKTCFLTRYAENTFQEQHMATLGIDYKLKNVQMDDGRTVKLQIWDTVGQDRFRSITKNYYKGANGIVVIYSVTDKQSCRNVKNWVNQIKAEVDEKVTIILVGNKIDDEENREVTTDEGEEIANNLDLQFFECSAKTGENIDSTFKELVKKIVEIGGKFSQKGDKLKQKQVGGEEKKKCC